MRELVEERGASVLFLPRYPPVLSPIEEAFSKVKALLRRTRARSREALVGAIGEALDMVGQQDALGWFAHCGCLRKPHLP